MNDIYFITYILEFSKRQKFNCGYNWIHKCYISYKIKFRIYEAEDRKRAEGGLLMLTFPSYKVGSEKEIVIDERRDEGVIIWSLKENCEENKHINIIILRRWRKVISKMKQIKKKRWVKSGCIWRTGLRVRVSGTEDSCFLL